LEIDIPGTGYFMYLIPINLTEKIESVETLVFWSYNLEFLERDVVSISGNSGIKGHTARTQTLREEPTLLSQE